METTLCRNPFMVGSMLPAGCYTCPPCRVKRKKQWSSRLWLESMCWQDNAFATLTYTEKELPENGTLVPTHVQGFLKRLRSRLSPSKIRFFMVGEYGSQTQRPHYHLILFNFRSCLRGTTDLRLESCCAQCDVVQESWKNPETGISFGKIQLGTVSEKACNYIAKYVVKGWNKNATELLRGRHPEFTRMSLRKGIGHPSLSTISESIINTATARNLVALSDVPLTYRSGKIIRPLGNYLRRELRKKLHISSDGKAPEIFSKKYWEELRTLRKTAASDPCRSKKIDSWKKYIVDIGTQKWLNQEARMNLKLNKGTL